MNNSVNNHDNTTLNNLTIASNEIRLLDDLYCLNDLHAASGAEKKHQPSNFIRLEHTQSLLAEIDKSSDVRSIKKVKGRHGGTYVCKELVYAYAMWISPKFNLVVIRAFDERQQQGQFQIPQSLPEALMLAAQQAKEMQAVKPKLVAYNRIAESDGSLSITQTAKTLQMKPKSLFSWLDTNSWIYRRVGTSEWTAYQKKIDSGCLEHKVTTFTVNDSEKVLTQARITPKGLTKLSKAFTNPNHEHR